EPAADLPSACLPSPLWLAVTPSRTRGSCDSLDEGCKEDDRTNCASGEERPKPIVRFTPRVTAMGVDLIVLQQLAVSFGIGLLLGLQRERAESSIGGIRTFPLIAIFGTVCALLGKTFGGWMVAAGLLALVAIVVYSNFAKIKSGDIDPGMTTEVAALLLYGLGAYVVIGSMVVTVVVGGAVAVLLQFKKPLHALAGAIGERDMRAIMQFVLLSLVILPVLPHQDFGPYGVWNPFQIWLMVVLIVGISLTGYIAYKCLGARRGTLLAGVLGGLISS